MIDLTPLEVRKKKGDFRRVMRGYEPALVDDFLDLVADRLDELVRQNLALTERVSRQEQQVADYRERERALTEALVTAQEMREEIRRQTAQEAELARRTAEQEVGHLRTSAQQDATQLRAAAQQEAAQLRASAQQEASALRTRVQQEVAELRTALRQEREREEEALRALRLRQQQFVVAYRAFLEEELNELGGITRALGLAGQSSPDDEGGGGGGGGPGGRRRGAPPLPGRDTPGGGAGGGRGAAGAAGAGGVAGLAAGALASGRGGGAGRSVPEPQPPVVLEEPEPFEPEPYEPEPHDPFDEDRAPTAPAAWTAPPKDAMPASGADTAENDVLPSPADDVGGEEALRSGQDDAAGPGPEPAADDRGFGSAARAAAWGEDDPAGGPDAGAGDTGVTPAAGDEGAGIAPGRAPGPEVPDDALDLYDVLAADGGEAGVPGPIGLGTTNWSTEPTWTVDGVDLAPGAGSGGDPSAAGGAPEDAPAGELELDDEVGTEEVDALLRNAAAAGYTLEDLDAAEELLLEDEAEETDDWLPDLLEDDDR